jgi:hypothetical protein
MLFTFVCGEMDGGCILEGFMKDIDIVPELLFAVRGSEKSRPWSSLSSVSSCVAPPLVLT